VERTSGDDGERGVTFEGDVALPTAEELERARLDQGWRRVVQLDSLDADDNPVNPESWDELTVERINTGPMFLPLAGDVAGPSVLRLQVLLDRALFSPGVMDGRWGVNTEKAIYWFQRREGLRATARADSVTFARLVQVAGTPGEVARRHTLTEEDVKGPFRTLPEDIYELAKQPCTCYESLREKLGELFHSTPELIAKLNPGVELNALRAGDRIWVPNVRDPAARGAPVARIVVSDEGRFLHALDASGRIVYHFPSTLGSSYDPSPTGDYRVTAIREDPVWHYQPKILAHVDDDKPDALIPPGPNNAVGVVWMALSVPHYGIHGTKAPETIGYASSAGCVRLTNWDALFLARRIEPGVRVQFQDRPMRPEG
jgi:lipoprotein-anchoring transpeptidase ErfK/SrfK